MLLLILTLIFGIGAAVIRGYQLTESFHPYTSLIEPGDKFTILLMVISVAFAVIAGAYLFMRRKKLAQITPPDGDTVLDTVRLIIQTIAPIPLAIASVYELFEGFDGVSWGDIFSANSGVRWSLVCLGLLGLLSTVALLMVSTNIRLRHSAMGFWATVPVFWSCLMLVVGFWGQSGVPVRNSFVYGMLASALCTLALYSFAGFFFGRAKPAKALFYATTGVFFSILTLGGFLFAQTLGTPFHELTTTVMLRHAFIILHLSAFSIAILQGRPASFEVAVPDTTSETEEVPDTEEATDAPSETIPETGDTPSEPNAE